MPINSKMSYSRGLHVEVLKNTCLVSFTVFVDSLNWRHGSSLFKTEYVNILYFFLLEFLSFYCRRKIIFIMQSHTDFLGLIDDYSLLLFYIYKYVLF